MISKIEFKGTRWFKCDLHLHTIGSACFQDRSVTSEQWVQRALVQGLNCVAVTDHNTGNQIDSIKAAAAGTDLIVFPGVEITCDTSKVHLLILFDVTKKSSDINDFLIKCNINRADFANQNAFTSDSIFDVAEIAHKEGALIIPAHIDEYNGLGSTSVDNLKKFFELDYINAVQVVHKEFMNPSLVTIGNSTLKQRLNDYYAQPQPSVDDAILKEWHTPVKYALSSGLAILTFSDNPHGPKNSKHGLDGIGTRSTWIKMDEVPTLEGLRQALLMLKFRVRNDFDTTVNPYSTPDLYMKSISVLKASITDHTTPLHLDLSPQLTTIIGGRGSGKSSILRFVRGLFNQTSDIATLHEILADHNDFYRKYDSRSEKGVITDDTIIEVEFVRNNILHRIRASSITNSATQSIVIEKFDSASTTWNVENAAGYIDFFQYEHYSQKQIYEIAQRPNSLKERIDKSITGVDELKSEREIIRKSFLEKSASIRTIQEQISGKGKLETEIKDVEEQIQLYQTSGIAALLISKEKFESQKNIFKEYILEVSSKEIELESIIGLIEVPNIDYTTFDQKEADEFQKLTKEISDGYILIKSELKKLKESANELREKFETSLSKTIWKDNYDKNEAQFELKKNELELQGINDISKFETLIEAKSIKTVDIDRIILLESTLATEIGEREQLKDKFLTKTKDIFNARSEYVKNLMQDDKIKVSIIPFRNRVDFVEKLRAILQRPIGFDSDIDFLTDLAFTGNVEQKIKDVKDIFKKLKAGISTTGIGGHFTNLINNLSDPQFDEIDLLWPDDEIEIKYKPSGSTSFKPLSTASAGQKTTAILTFILSQGNIPLLLDQPEDDLDNRLVYELIVDRLKQAKEFRQIIVVTHNANIPVNGDAEYILSMNSESKKLSVLLSGTVEDKEIKKEICDVMEGTEHAFDMRSKRYKSITR